MSATKKIVILMIISDLLMIAAGICFGVAVSK